MAHDLPKEALEAEEAPEGTQEEFSAPSDPLEIDGDVQNEGQDAQALEGSAVSNG